MHLRVNSRANTRRPIVYVIDYKAPAKYNVNAHCTCLAEKRPTEFLRIYLSSPETAISLDVFSLMF